MAVGLGFSGSSWVSATSIGAGSTLSGVAEAGGVGAAAAGDDPAGDLSWKVKADGASTNNPKTTITSYCLHIGSRAGGSWRRGCTWRRSSRWSNGSWLQRLRAKTISETNLDRHQLLEVWRKTWIGHMAHIHRYGWKSIIYCIWLR